MVADRSHDLATEQALRAAYSPGPAETSLAKSCDHLHPLYRPYIEASPFAVLATRGPHGLDASPRGDRPGFVAIADDKTLLLPDRRGNQRIDSLRNILHDPHVALLFLIPGVGETLRVEGTARISATPALRERFSVDGKAPASVLVITVDCVFFQCARAIKRSALWDPARHIERSSLPSPGEILEILSSSGVDGRAYDSALQARQAATLY
ncbi:pyridoxamine 5'-phosphate oxidase family protein [Ideonella sp. YS5]|uniref:pyridoxamine 5'-phosphate oxidase family protein n=1 Tax=Ideonella sp. YS5 TaxID=3453714 RepID=UPI003EEC1720